MASSASAAAPVALRHTDPPSRTSASPDWQSYVETPSSADVGPTAVVSASGDVTGAQSLVHRAGGKATLTLVPGGSDPTLVLDYGKEVGGLPYFAVSAESGSPTLKAGYSEGLQYESPNGDGSTPWAEGDPSRSDSYTVSGPGTIANSYVQGGERYEEITLTSPGSVTLSAVGIHYIADRTQAGGYAGYFDSSSDELNKIWYDSAYTLQTDAVPAGSLPGSWAVKDQALDDVGSPINEGVGVLNRGTSWGDYTSTFQADISSNQAGWLVRGQDSEDGYLFILNDSTDTTGTPNTLQEFDLHDGQYTALGQVPLTSPVAAGSWHTVATAVSSGSITVSLDGTPIATLDLASLPSGAVAYSAGTVGFREYTGEEASFRDLSIVSSTGSRLYTNALDSTAELADFTAPGVNALPSVVDGAKRDRAIWVGDLNVEGPTDFYSIDNAAYIKDSLELLGSYQLSSGFVTGTLVPEAVPRIGPLIPGTTTTYSASYSMYYVTALESYYLYTGDKAFAAKEWPVVQRELAWNAAQLDSNGLFTTDSADGADWDYYDAPKTGEVSEYNILYYQTLLDGAVLAKAAGQPSAAATYTADAAALKTAINTHLYNSGTGLYDLSNTETTQVAQDANAMAVLYGVAPASEDAGILAALKTDLWTTSYGPTPYSGNSGDSTIISPFISGFELDARFADNDAVDAETLMETEWGHMIAPGPDQTGTMWENISTDGAPGNGAGSSLSHGWSTAPLSALSGYVLGVQPATAGYATWTVQPHPGDLTWSKGRVPTPHGDIDVDWTGPSTAARFTMDVTAPAGTTGTIAIPTDGAHNAVVTVNGHVVWRNGSFATAAGITGASAAAGYVYLTGVRPGTYRVVSSS